jgi:hypothetical protein
MKVIGLTGFAKSGKSTAAEILKSLGGEEVAFAKHLKDVCAAVFNIERSHFDDQAFKELKLSYNRIITPYDVERVLNYFEIPSRFIPGAVLAHQNTELTSPRHVAQYVGTEILRTIDENIHINMAFKMAAASKAPFFICSDMRFNNELNAVQENEGLSIGISRQKATPADLENLHGSEKEIPVLIKQCDWQIQNEGTIEDLQNTVREAAQKYLKR